MTTAFQLRRINQRRIIHAMMRLHTSSRAQLAKATGMSQPTVSRIVDELLSDAILLEVDGESGEVRPQRGDLATAAPAQLGRPRRPLELDRNCLRYLAIHVGVHQTRLAALPLALTQADKWPVQVTTPHSPDAWAEAIGKAWRQVPTEDVEAVVLSIPGVVDEQSGRVLLSPNLRWAERADFRRMIGSFTRVPVVFIQEIRALALGQLAAEPEIQDFLLVDFGSGVGSAAVVGGRLRGGPLPLSGELGHTPVLGNRRPCGCGGVGCLETLVSRDGLVASSAQAGGPDAWPALIEHLRGESLPDWLKPSLDALAMTIAGALNMMGLRQVLLTGSIEQLPPAAIEYLHRQLRSDAMWGRFGDVACRLAPRRRMAGMVSAAINEVLLADRL